MLEIENAQPAATKPKKSKLPYIIAIGAIVLLLLIGLIVGFTLRKSNPITDGNQSPTVNSNNPTTFGLSQLTMLQFRDIVSDNSTRVLSSTDQ